MLESDTARAQGKRSSMSAGFFAARAPQGRFSKEDWMNRTVIRTVVLIFIAGLVAMNCESPAANSAPTITALNLPDTVQAGNDATFSCTASDPDGDPLSYSWTTTAGALLSTNAKTVGWTAPDHSGSALVTVVVQDSAGAADTSSGMVAVSPVVTNIIDWTGRVEARDFQVWHNYLPGGYTLSGSFSAGGQFITFLVLDPANYPKWGSDSSFVGLVKIDSSAGSTFSAVVPATGLYHIILDNRENPAADTAVHVLVQTTSP